MHKLYSNFRGYLRINIPNIKWVLLFGAIFFVFFILLKQRGYVKRYTIHTISIVWGILLSLSCSFIFVMTLFGRKIGAVSQYRVIPFETYYHVFIEEDMEVLLQLLVNVLMFVALGVVLPCCFQYFEKLKNIVRVLLGCSLAIELIQFTFEMGLFEIDDIVHNVLGAIIGLGLYRMCDMLRRGLGVNDERKY